MYPPLERLDCSRGAPMGRYAVLDADTKAKLCLYKLKLIDGDYDQGAAYWGHSPGTHIFRAVSLDGTQEMFVRAANRDAAKTMVSEVAPNARFYK